MGVAFDAARRRGEEAYRDTIHPNELGQRLMAEALVGPIEALARQGAGAPPVGR
jgi:lysophospholipase L1-like esterase